MTQTLQELADYIVNEIEKEDFLYSIKHYGCYKAQTTAKKFLRLMEHIDEAEK